MKEWLKQLFCRHKYEVVGTILFKDYTTYLLECTTCEKRKVVKSLKDIFKMWKKHEVELNFEDIKENE